MAFLCKCLTTEISIWGNSPRSIILKSRLRKESHPCLSGPNTIGGSINLVSFQPTDKVNVQAITGLGSGNTYEYGINAGSRREKFFVQGSYYERHTDYFTLSHSYQPTTYQPDRTRDNSYSDFRKVNLKIGYIAAPDQEFTSTINIRTMQKEIRHTVVSMTSNRPILAVARMGKTSLYFISKQNKRKQRYQDKYLHRQILQCDEKLRRPIVHHAE